MLAHPLARYNDPPYVKVEKLDILVRLAAESNIDILLPELKEFVLIDDSAIFVFNSRQVLGRGRC